MTNPHPVNLLLLAGCLGAACAWMLLGYRSHVAHHANPPRRTPVWEVGLEFLMAMLAGYCLLQLLLDQLQL